jgi:hypothetical protein
VHVQSSMIHHPSSTRSGAVLTLVIVALMLTGVVMFVLAGGTQAMLFQADTAWLQAVERDLTASGLAWTRQRLANNRAAPMAEPQELSVAALGVPNARLAVRILKVQEGGAEVRVETSCRKARRTLETTRDHTIRL